MAIRREKCLFAAYLADPDGEVDSYFSIGNNFYKVAVSVVFMIPMLQTPSSVWWFDPVRGELEELVGRSSVLSGLAIIFLFLGYAMVELYC
jgi:hypothetical protein